MNDLSLSVSEIHSNFLESCEILNDFEDSVHTFIHDLSEDLNYLSKQGKELLNGEPVDYTDLFFRDKTKEEITELSEHFTKEAHRFGVSYPTTFENMVFIYLVAIFDAFFEDLTRTVLIHIPNMLEATNRNNRDEQIQKEIKNFSGRLANQVKYWNSKFSITIEASGVEFNSMNLIFEKRHVLVHRNGIVDDKFIKNTGSKEFTKGESIKIEPQYFYDSLDKLQKVADYLAQEIVTKFC